MTIPIQAQTFNPVSGSFGTGQIQFFFSSGTWTVPLGIGKVRVRLWGGGGGGNNIANGACGGSGGGFALKTIYDLSGVTSIAVTVGAGGTVSGSLTSATFGGTSSFGSYVSATGGTSGYSSLLPVGGTGVGGDINNNGGNGINSASSSALFGGGSASIFGNGGSYSQYFAPGGAGAGGNNGFVGLAATSSVQATTGQSNIWSIDFIGVGGGASTSIVYGVNGGGSYSGGAGSIPAGGGGNGGIGGQGIVIVEW